MKEIDDIAGDTLEDEDALEDEVDEDVEPTETDLAEAADLPPDPVAGGDVESIQELIVKQEGAEAEEVEEDVPEPVTRGDTAEPVDHRVVPMQSSEFQCTNCFLVKHRSQLADPKKMRCRDCA
jgi:hypothetical protein